MSYYFPKTYRVRDSIGYLIRHATNLLTARAESVFSSHEITFVQWLVLMYLRDGIASTAAEISRQMRHDSGALTRVVENLADRGFIERNRSAQDRRVVELTLTKTGQEAIASLTPLIVNCLNTAMDGLTHEEIDSLTVLLKKLIVGLTATLPGTAASTPALEPVL